MNREFRDRRRRGIGVRAMGRNQFPYLLYDDFLTAASAPISTPRTCEPGPGRLTILDSANNNISIASGKLVVSGTTASASRHVDAQTFPRVMGRMFEIVVYEMTTPGTLRIGLDPSASNTPQYRIDYASATTVNIINDTTTILSGYNPGSYPHKWRWVVRPTGAYLFFDTTFLWAFEDSTFDPVTMYMWFNDAVPYDLKFENVGIRDKGWPFTVDNAIALVHRTDFTQSLGSEKIANGTFSDLTGWSAASTPATFEAVGGRLHVVTDSSGDGATSTNFSPTLATGWYEGGFDYELVSGRFDALISTNSGGFQPGTFQTLGSRTFKGVWFNTSALGRASQFVTNVATPSEWYIDNVTLKPINENNPDVATADGLWKFNYTIPVSPGGGELVAEMIRWLDDNNCWLAGVQRNNANSTYDFFLNSVASGTATNRVSASGVGDTDGLCVMTNGNLYDCYTKSGTTLTKRGSQVNNSTGASNTGFRTLYNSTMIPLLRQMIPRTSNNYNVLAEA